MDLLNLHLTALGWSQPCDVWSIGCILIEYYLGFTVFPVRNYGFHSAAASGMLLTGRWETKKNGLRN